MSEIDTNSQSKDLVALSIGISDFQKMILGNYYIADKTLLIKEIMDDLTEVILITRPRRFGKTLNLSMLNYFFQVNSTNQRNLGAQNLFEHLNISQHKDFCLEHQNQYPTIFISFKDIKADKFEKAYPDIVSLFSKLYSEHRYLLEGDFLESNEKEVFHDILHERASQSKLEVAIKNLSEFLHRKFGKNPIILIDEYDTPIQEAYLCKYYDEMIRLMRGIFGESLKDNKYLTKAVLTGITRISQESMFSGLNNIQVYSLLKEKYGQYFGFTEEEVLNLKNKLGNSVDVSAFSKTKCNSEVSFGYKETGLH